MDTLRRYSFNLIPGLILTVLAFGTAGAVRKAAPPDSGLKADTGKAVAETVLQPKKHHEVVVGVGPGEKNGSIKIKTGDKEINIDIDKNKHFKEGDVYVAVTDTIHEDIAARGNVTVAGVAEGDVAAIGGAVSISGKVEGDVAAIGGPVTLTQGGEVGGAPPGRHHLHHKGPPRPEHPGVDILPPCPVEDGIRGLEHPNGRPPDELLDRVGVHLPREAAPLATGPMADPAGPPGLGYPPLELPVPAAEEEGGYLELDTPFGKIQDRHDVGVGEVRGLSRDSGDCLPHLAVHLGLEGLGPGEPEIGPDRLLALGHEGGHPRPDEVGGMLDP